MGRADSRRLAPYLSRCRTPLPPFRLISLLVTWDLGCQAGRGEERARKSSARRSSRRRGSKSKLGGSPVADENVKSSAAAATAGGAGVLICLFMRPTSVPLETPPPPRAIKPNETKRGRIKYSGGRSERRKSGRPSPSKGETARNKIFFQKL